MRSSTITTALILAGAVAALPTPEQYEKRLDKKFTVELYVEPKRELQEIRDNYFDIEFEVERDLPEIREELHLVKRPETTHGTVTSVEKTKREGITNREPELELTKRPETCRGTVTTVQESKRGSPQEHAKRDAACPRKVGVATEDSPRSVTVATEDSKGGVRRAVATEDNRGGRSVATEDGGGGRRGEDSRGARFVATEDKAVATEDSKRAENSVFARSITKPPQRLDAAKADRREPLDGSSKDAAYFDRRGNPSSGAY
ncbi:hypothetical protein DL96DRAFT_1816385 [Flagelloscypha sp. PMI_526]|nr:hypothetical protein DL96DRAFT_1816385 [Flagelloscypha sp. PMI_526]